MLSRVPRGEEERTGDVVESFVDSAELLLDSELPFSVGGIETADLRRRTGRRHTKQFEKVSRVCAVASGSHFPSAHMFDSQQGARS